MVYELQASCQYGYVVFAVTIYLSLCIHVLEYLK